MFSKIYLIFIIFFQYYLIFIYCNNSKENDDFHSSVTALNEVLNSEKQLIKNFADYIVRARENLNYLKSLINNWNHDHYLKIGEKKYTPTAGSTKFIHLKALINSISKKCKFLWDIRSLRNFFNVRMKRVALIYKEQNKANLLPTINDLKDVTLGLLRIQEVYDIPAIDIANGVVDGINFGTKFSASDCFEVASQLAGLGCYHYAIEWYEITLERINEEGWKGIQPEIEKNLIISYFTQSLYKEGGLQNTKIAIKISMEALKENCCNKNELYIMGSLINYIEHLINLNPEERDSPPVYPPKGALYEYNMIERNLLKKGCKGELRKSWAEERKLFCKYENKNHPFLLLAPIKFEILNLSPYLAIFHEILYDSEIETLKELSTNKLVRTEVWDEVNEETIPSQVRTSKFVWFDNETHPLIHILNQRTSDMTDLTMETAEDFQLMNYGIGGHYDIHGDYYIESIKSKYFPLYSWGNRIATLLFYMSDVTHGGGTVWPYLNTLVFPKKGTAAFWYNLYHDGEPDFRSQHTACPIIVGSKWVVNKWIRMSGQIFRKPCHKL